MRLIVVIMCCIFGIAAGAVEKDMFSEAIAECLLSCTQKVIQKGEEMGERSFMVTNGYDLPPLDGYETEFSKQKIVILEKEGYNYDPSGYSYKTLYSQYGPFVELFVRCRLLLDKLIILIENTDVSDIATRCKENVVIPELERVFVYNYNCVTNKWILTYEGRDGLLRAGGQYEACWNSDLNYMIPYAWMNFCKLIESKGNEANQPTQIISWFHLLPLHEYDEEYFSDEEFSMFSGRFRKMEEPYEIKIDGLPLRPFFDAKAIYSEPHISHLKNRFEKGDYVTFIEYRLTGNILELIFKCDFVRLTGEGNSYERLPCYEYMHTFWFDCDYMCWRTDKTLFIDKHFANPI